MNGIRESLPSSRFNDPKIYGSFEGAPNAATSGNNSPCARKPLVSITYTILENMRQQVFMLLILANLW